MTVSPLGNTVFSKGICGAAASSRAMSMAAFRTPTGKVAQMTPYAGGGPGFHCGCLPVVGMPIIERTRLQRSTFLVLFALALYGLWRTLAPIWVPVLLGRVTGIVTGLFSAVFIFIFTALTSYYLLREGTAAPSWLIEMVPLPDGQVEEIVEDVRDVMRAILMSTGLMSIYQAVTAGIGYW